MISYFLSSQESQQRGLMQEGMDIMSRTSDSVARSQRIAAETGKLNFS